MTDPCGRVGLLASCVKDPGRPSWDFVPSRLRVLFRRRLPFRPSLEGGFAMRRTTTWLLAMLLLPAANLRAAAAPSPAPLPPHDAAKAMKLPDGFSVTLFAGEPDVVQPIAFTFDDRGRLWVVQCLSYPKWIKD